MTEMNPTKYPIGIQTFEDIRTGGWAYADKTEYVYQLAHNSKQLFLSRPRRFGKSLLLSTFQAYFEGKKELFEGLALGRLETEWQSYPVLRFDFSSLAAKSTEVMEEEIDHYLAAYEKKFGLESNSTAPSIGTRFGDLIKNVAEKTGKKVVVLIDEYDKGIVDILQNKEHLDRNIVALRPFFVQLKAQDEYLRFVFLTGVSRFRNLTLFSSPNQLQDISMMEDYATICGLTSGELGTIFVEGIRNFANRRGYTVEEATGILKQQYDGYRFTEAEEHVFNPFSILNCLSQGRLGSYWLASGGASKVFIDFLKEADYNLNDIETMWVSEETLSGPYSLEDPIPLLFQTGYLTIADYARGRYRLKIPNGEVRSALVDQLVPLYLGIDKHKTGDLLDKIWMFTEDGEAEKLMLLFQQIISKIPHQEFRHNDVEAVYHLAMSLICQMAGINARSEVSVAGGDIDMLIENRDYVYVLEFKKDHSAEEALKQIDTNAYALPWRADGRRVIKVGVSFSSANRNISSWIIRRLESH